MMHAKGTWRRPCSAERRERELQEFSMGPQSSKNRSEQDPANNAIPMQPSYIQFAASGESAQDVAHITRDVVIIMRPIRRAEERRTRSRLQLRRVSGRPVGYRDSYN